MRWREPGVRAAALTLFVLLVLAPARVPASSEEQKGSSSPVTDAERDEAILRGLRYLTPRVFRLPDASGTPRKPFTVAVHGLVHLLADDRRTRTDGRGDAIADARAYLLRYVEDVRERTADPVQLPTGPGAFDTRHVIQYTWPLAMAAFFFGELHARGLHRAEAARAIGRIRALLLDAQRESGGWGHHKVADTKARGRNLPPGATPTRSCRRPSSLRPASA